MGERRPPWLRAPLPAHPMALQLARQVRQARLATVCESASCPNKGECWSRGFLTVMILGDTCTRTCRFCGVQQGAPLSPDGDEPLRVASLLAGLHPSYVVLTSVDRDDLPDGGASHWAATIRAVRRSCPDAAVEALVPDFQGRLDLVDLVLEARPDVFSHNVETVRSLHPMVRPQADYATSLHVLRHASRRGFATKSGLMVGLGERSEEVAETIRDLADVGVEVITVGQYLQPRRDRWPVARYWSPEEFDALRRLGESLGVCVHAGPLVRSSYRADQWPRAQR